MKNLVIALIFYFVSLSLVAAEVKISPEAGYMQQPASQYYLASYGAALGLIFDKNRNHSLDVSWLSRPRFEANGFAEGDTGYFLKYGVNFNEISVFRLNGVVGAGSIEGYVESTDDLDDEGASTYRMIGPLFGANLTLALGPWLEMKISHEMLVGISSAEDLRLFITWPFRIMTVSIGVIF